MKEINGKKVKITRAGYLYIDGARIKKIVPFGVPTQEVTGDEAITEYAREWFFRHYTLCNA